VDLVYLDPPFNSNRAYNVFTRSAAGIESAAQIQAFDDTWHWSQGVEAEFDRLLAGGAPSKVADAMSAMRQLLQQTDMMAYLVMIAWMSHALHDSRAGHDAVPQAGSNLGLERRRGARR
jgi:hypothetical protein